MKPHFIRLIICSLGALLLATAIAKLVSAAGTARSLQQPDPVFLIPFQRVFAMVGTLEIFTALVCLFGKRVKLQACLVAWLATNFLLYRLTLLLIGWHKPCPCLGNLTDALHMSPKTAHNAMKIILAYLLIGSYATLFWLWRQKKRTPSL